MFERFSGGYYLGRLYVEPHGGERAVMQRDQHERVNEQLYATGDGLERLDAPLVMKLDTNHFPVHGDTSVPADTLALPRALLDGCRVSKPPELREVLLATADHAARLIRFSSSVIARNDTYADSFNVTGRSRFEEHR